MITKLISFTVTEKKGCLDSIHLLQFPTSLYVKHMYSARSPTACFTFQQHAII